MSYLGVVGYVLFVVFLFSYQKEIESLPYFWVWLAIFCGYCVVSIISVTRKTRRLILVLLSRDTSLLGLSLNRKSGGFLERGVIYVHLHHLEQAGLVRSWRVDSSGIREYELTSKGALEAARIQGHATRGG